MARAKFFSGLLLLLFILLNGWVSNGREAASFATTGNTAKTFTLNNTAGNQVLCIKPLLVKSHIKVRYMGGECGFNPVALVINAPFAGFIDGEVHIGDRFFLSSCSRFLFKLRGPPVADDRIYS